ncbi:hypothetical protein N473_06925 [Pseudoalteromonas luteoviolacea CPMOR-1]|uniref:DUF2190 domain-containing protein n=1 Tax=Pseudoalteromonas luteoviolacea CPMOR-1 TaxID=1365248 RepID=A0A167H3Y4_9GAMM|nr:hypothetical protein [Pseudoalteromonas luteoviolacea]KZN57605.1 hypothetical protein N473_06925 [Pseudoalteromonas luteoviolacea CPMOR-1]
MSAIATRDGRFRGYPLAGGEKLTANKPAILSNGLLVSVGAVGVCAGVIRETVDNSQGVDKAIRGSVEIGEHMLPNSGDINETHVGQTAFFVDATSNLSIDSATNTRSTAGTITEVDSRGVWVNLGV